MHTRRVSPSCITNNHTGHKFANWLDLPVSVSNQSTSILGWTITPIHCRTGLQLDPEVHLMSAGGTFFPSALGLRATCCELVLDGFLNCISWVSKLLPFWMPMDCPKKMPAPRGTFSNTGKESLCHSTSGWAVSFCTQPSTGYLLYLTVPYFSVHRPAIPHWHGKQRTALLVFNQGIPALSSLPQLCPKPSRVLPLSLLLSLASEKIHVIHRDC